MPTWNAFADQTDAWVTTQLAGEYRFKAGVIHEALHGFILDDGHCDDVTALTGPDDDEHSLGQISNQGAAGDLTSPMVIGNVEEGVHADGRCDRDADSGGPTKVVTRCTVNAVAYSRAHSLHVLPRLKPWGVLLAVLYPLRRTAGSADRP